MMERTRGREVGGAGDLDPSLIRAEGTRQSGRQGF